MTSAPLNSAGTSLKGAETKKPTARFASGGGLETLCCLLAVSPVARSACSARNGPRSRDRNDRHGNRFNGPLIGDVQHAESIAHAAAILPENCPSPQIFVRHQQIPKLP